MAHGLSQALQVAGILLAVVLGVVAGAIAVYVLGSFFLMGGHATERRLAVSTRELVRELFWAGLSQPLLPLFYVLGARHAGGGGTGGERTGVPIVFVHGYMQNRVGFVFLARALARRGLGPMFGFNYPWFASIPGNARRLEAFVARVCEETNSAAVDLVCHSMGGLVGMEMMRRASEKQRLRVRRCVTIATPHAGVAWRGPIFGVDGASLRRGSKLLEAQAATKLVVPCLSVYSSHDNIVHPKETSQLAARGGRDVEVQGLAHLAILFSGDVASHVASFLLEPDAPRESEMKNASSDPTPARASGNLEDR